MGVERGYNDRDVGIGYTLATGRLFCPMNEFHAYAELLLDRPIYTHEFGNTAVWDQLRKAFEYAALEAII